MIGRENSKANERSGSNVLPKRNLSRRTPMTADPRSQSATHNGLVLVMVVAAIAATVPIFAGAETPASPPCGGTSAQPPYAAIGAAPSVKMWKNQGLPRLPASGECFGWATPAFRTLIAVAGTFQNTSGADALLARFGGISRLLLARYWSTTDQTWRPLVLAATALTHEVAGQPREDFNIAELKSGENLYLSQRDSRGASEVIYRMRVLESMPDRFVIETENVTSIRLFALTMFKPGDLRSLYFIEQHSPGIWTYYGMTRISGGSWLVAGHEKSYINRAVALYRHFTGIPTDLEPPPAK